LWVSPPTVTPIATEKKSVRPKAIATSVTVFPIREAMMLVTLCCVRMDEPRSPPNTPFQ
jgi:hypothetical protein